jgi:hypothetical protein
VVKAGARKSSSRRQTSASKTPGLLSRNQLGKAVKKFQNEPDDETARQQWKRIEKSVFGVRYDD